MEMKQGQSYTSETAKLKSSCGNLFITTVFGKSELPIKILIDLGKAGGCTKAHLSVLSEYINLALSQGDSAIIPALSHFTGITCSEGNSCIDVAIQYVLEKIIKIKETQIDHE